MLSLPPDSSQVSVKFEVVMEVSSEEKICKYEELVEESNITDFYTFKFVKSEKVSPSGYISFQNHVLGAIHGNISIKFLENLYPRILETYKDYISHQNGTVVLQMQ